MMTFAVGTEESNARLHLSNTVLSLVHDVLAALYSFGVIQILWTNSTLGGICIGLST